MPNNKCDVAIIGAGPAGAAAAIRAARGGAKVTVFEKALAGRDKVCGDGLTPRAVYALEQLEIDLSAAHRIDGLRMVANDTRRELSWPQNGPFAPNGAVWPRRHLDSHLMVAAANAGAEILWQTEGTPLFGDDLSVIGVETETTVWKADLTVIATGAPGKVARMLGAQRSVNEPHGVAIRGYASSPRHAERLLEACLTLRDPNDTPIPGYGWLFPAGDGTVNIGVGALSTMKGYRNLNLNHLINSYRDLIREEWQLGDYLERPRAWRLPMSVQSRFGSGWVAIGDAAGLINPMNGEGIDYGLESGMLVADLFLTDPASTPTNYDQIIGQRFDAFLRTGRRFSYLIGHPLILRSGLRLAVGTQAIANITLQVMGNLLDTNTSGAAQKVLRIADRGLGLAEPLLRRSQSRRR